MKTFVNTNLATSFPYAHNLHCKTIIMAKVNLLTAHMLKQHSFLIGGSIEYKVQSQRISLVFRPAGMDPSLAIYSSIQEMVKIIW